MLNKKSQSQIIGTVLLILLVIASVTILSVFLLNFVKENLKDDCFKISQKYQIKNSPRYSCYNSTNQQVSLQIHIDDISEKIYGFKVELGGADSKAFDINPITPSADIHMYTLNSPIIELPKDNEERTYLISGITSKPDNINLYLVLNDKSICQNYEKLDTVTSCQG